MAVVAAATPPNDLAGRGAALARELKYPSDDRPDAVTRQEGEEAPLPSESSSGSGDDGSTQAEGDARGVALPVDQPEGSLPARPDGDTEDSADASATPASDMPS